MRNLSLFTGDPVVRGIELMVHLRLILTGIEWKTHYIGLLADNVPVQRKHLNTVLSDWALSDWL